MFILFKMVVAGCPHGILLQLNLSVLLLNRLLISSQKGFPCTNDADLSKKINIFMRFVPCETSLTNKKIQNC